MVIAQAMSSCGAGIFQSDLTYRILAPHDRQVISPNNSVLGIALPGSAVHGGFSFDLGREPARKLAALGVPFVFSTGYSAQDMRTGYRDQGLPP